MYEFEKGTEVEYLSQEEGCWKTGKVLKECSISSDCLYVENILDNSMEHCLVRDVRYKTGAPLMESYSNPVLEYHTPKPMKELTKTQKSFIDEDTQALIEAEFIFSDLTGLTDKGKAAVLQFIFTENKPAIVALAKELIKEEKKTNKS